MTVETIVSAPLGVAGKYPSHQAELGKGGIHIFLDTASRDKMWDSLKIANKTIALVKDGQNNYPSWFIWTGIKWDFAGYFGGMVLADTDGALTRIESTAVFGPDFKIQSAGDVGNGVLLMLSDEVKDELAKKLVAGAAFKTGPYLELKQKKDGNILEIKPGAFELAHEPSYLAYIQGQTFINKNSTPVTADIHSANIMSFGDVVFDGGGVYLSMDEKQQSFTIQEADQGDPDVTGGTDYLISLRISMQGVAPSDGSVMVYMYDSSISPFDKDTYLEDVKGDPLVAAKHYSKSDVLDIIDLTGIVNAKGMKSFTCHIVTDFSESIELDDRYYGGTGLMVQSITPKVKTGTALLQFESDTDNRLWFEHDPNTGYKLRESHNYGSTRGKFTEFYEAFIQNTQGFASLRYTVNTSEIPLPCGVAMKGSANVEVDPSVNQVGGSQAKGGEGAIKFKADGNAQVSTTVRINNETDHGSTATLWWATVASDGSMTKIDDSEKVVTVMAGVKNQEVVMPTFTLLVENGDRIALRGKSDYADGVYIQTDNDRYPLIETTLDFKEILPQNP